MSAITSIEWTDRTWNPIRGCSRVSAGCEHCYAELIAARFSGQGMAYEGLARRRSNGAPQWTGRIRVVPDALKEPLHWRKPARVFVNSMSDLFHENAPDSFIAAIFAVMALAPRHTFQILTKRPERMRALLDDGFRYSMRNAALGLISETREDLDRLERWPLPNVWLGVSVENQAVAADRIYALLRTPAAVRFLSCEPLLGRLDLRRLQCVGADYQFDALTGEERYDGTIRRKHLPAVDWIIIGGESGSGARAFDLAWPRFTLAQSRALAQPIPVFVKQLGASPECRNDDYSERWPGSSIPLADEYEPRYQGEVAPLELRDRKGGDPDEWPEDLRVRQFPDAKVPA